jgi:hypothetical protein
VKRSGSDIAACNCGRVYNHAGWEHLVLIGGMDADDQRYPLKILELRNCLCGSTISLTRTSSAPTRESRGAAVTLLNFEATRQRAAREERKRRETY